MKKLLSTLIVLTILATLMFSSSVSASVSNPTTLRNKDSILRNINLSSLSNLTREQLIELLHNFFNRRSSSNQPPVSDNTGSNQNSPTPTPTTPASSPTPTPQAPQPTVAPQNPPQNPSSVPVCTSHDPLAWHGLYDSANNCHYQHEHKHNPNELNSIFGDVSSWWNGTQEISYPWQTPDENLHKHNVYGWITRSNIPAHSSNYIKDFRLQYHAMSANPGIATRYHSFSLEAQICRAGGNCGIVKTGGWLDFGKLEVLDYQTQTHYNCLLADDPRLCSSTGRRKIHYRYPSTSQWAAENKETQFFWYSRQDPMDGSPSVLRTIVALATNDAWSNVNPNAPTENDFFCPDYRCNKNGSTIQSHVVQLRIPGGNYDPEGDGYADFKGWTNRYGVPVTNCSIASLDCVPLVLENVPVGTVQHRDDTHLGLSPAGLTDFDTSPSGEYWITFPN